MRAAGCETVVDAKDLAVVGITEILNHLPKILGLYKHLIAEADRRKPDLAIVIDSPAFNWRVARQMKKRGIPTVYYVAPQFWAWRQGRVRLIRDYINKALVIFPFEEKFYRERGVDASFVGHPLAELPDPSIERADYARQFQLDADKQWIALMPGSRVKEVRMNLPTILESVALLGPGYEYLLPGRAHTGPQLAGNDGAREEDHARARCPACPVSLPRGDRRQRHSNGGGRDDESAVCNGLPRLRVDLPFGEAPGQGAPVRHGEPDCGGRSRP